MSKETPLVVAAKELKLKPKSNHRVLEIRCHIGVQFAGEVLTSVSADKHKAIMSLHPAGVFVQYKTHLTIVPFGNCHFVKLDPEDFA